MLLFRSLSVGLSAAVLVMLATQAPPIALEPPEPAAAQCPEPTRTDVTIVDVAPGVDATTIASLVRLDPSETIARVDGRGVDGNIAGGAAIAAHQRSFIDVELSSGRRVLLLLH